MAAVHSAPAPSPAASDHQPTENFFFFFFFFFFFEKEQEHCYFIQGKKRSRLQVVHNTKHE
jgi:hypothetical protein